MDTKKLYYTDSQLMEFTANVLSCEPVKGGWAVILDQTAFYPEGGGQPCDLGTLGDANVTDVQEREGNLIHYCDKPLSGEVFGRADWNRRLDLMQQHTGEHILSGVICGKYGANNVGFHIGAETVTIDFDVMIPQEDLPELEARANTAIWEDAPVCCFVPQADQLQNWPYRSKKALEGEVRLVSIPHYDCCACCGTHLQRAGQVGMIKILSMVKFHQGVRLEILCGKRAFAHYQKIWEQNKLVSAAFSAKPLETGAAAARMNEALAAEKIRAANLEKQVFSAIAQGYAGRENVVHRENGLTPVAVRELADRIAGSVSGWAAVYSGTDEAGYSICIISRTETVKDLGARAAAALNGRGGGKPNAFQGNLKATAEAIEGFFRELT